MNLFHQWCCKSDYWARSVERTLLPWALKDVDLGVNTLEIGPGCGANMRVLVDKTPQTEGLAAMDTIGADSLSLARLHSAAAGYSAQIGDLEFAAEQAQETLRLGHQEHLRFFIMTGL